MVDFIRLSRFLISLTEHPLILSFAMADTFPEDELEDTNPERPNYATRADLELVRSEVRGVRDVVSVINSRQSEILRLIRSERETNERQDGELLSIRQQAGWGAIGGALATGVIAILKAVFFGG